MKRNLIKSALAIVATAGFTLTANAQAPSCDNITWNAQALERLPTAPDHCLEVVERSGAWYAKMRAQVVRQGPASTTIRFQNSDGSWSDAERLHPPRGMTAEIDGREVRIADMGAGQEVNIYALSDEYFSVPAQVAAAAPASAPTTTEAAPAYEPEPEPEPAMLPKTAGNANWLALIGIMLLVLSAGLYIRRQF
jgi:LPXTG-motif cell wall-anchored protein